MSAAAPERRAAVIRPLGIAAAAAILYVLLGIAVSHAPPSAIDRAGAVFAGEAPRLALLLTESCWWELLLVFGAGAVVLAVAAPHWRARAIYAALTTLITWQLSDGLKLAFRRPRPDYWHLIHEPTYSYSSGHAMFALLVYGLWGWFVWRSELPARVRTTVAPLLWLWACGVLWSRLALGAHYVTDLAGGMLLGTATLAAGAAIRSAWAAHDRRTDRTLF